MQIYYARGNEVSDSQYESLLKLFKSAYEELNEEECVIVRHNRNKSGYNPQLLTDSDIVIMITADPSQDKLAIGVGLVTELELAHKHGIPVFVLIQKPDSAYPFIKKVNATHVKIINPQLWTAGHAKIVPHFNYDIFPSYCVVNEFNVKHFWRVEFNKEGQKPKAQNKSGDRQNEDSGKRILLLG